MHLQLLRILTLTVITALLSSGCNSRTTIQDADPQPRPAIDPATQFSVPWYPGSYDPGEYSAVHETSETDTDIPGFSELTEEGQNNYEDPGIEALVIAPGAEDDLAFAVYDLAGLGVDRPINFDIDVDAAPLLPGGDDPLPLNYWVGLSNYTKNSWEWFGPFDQSQSLEMNSPTVLERYIGNSGILYYCLATVSDDAYVNAQNPDGLTACQINVGTVTTETAASPDYNETKPLFVPIETHTPSSLAPPKGGSALDSTQYVTINWTHTGDPQSPLSGPQEYEIFRFGAGDDQPRRIGSTAAPGNSYVDPTDNDTGIPEATPGETYQYFLRAVNSQGHTSFDGFSATIPSIGWTHSWGTADFDSGLAIAYDVDGEIYVTGSADGDFLLMAFRADGTLINQFTIGGILSESGRGICVDADGDKYVAGDYTDGFGQSTLVMFNFTAGNTKEWDKSWEVDKSRAYDIVCDTVTNQVYVTGSVSELVGSTILLKLDSTGDIVTAPQSWGGSWTDDVNSNSSFGQAIALGPGAIFVAGHYSSDINGPDAMVMKVDDDDQSLAWAKSWGTADGDGAKALAVDSDDGSVYFTGFHSDDQVMVVKLFPNGLVAWQKWWSVTGKTGQGYAIVLSGDNVIVAGELSDDAFMLTLSKGTGDLVSQETWGTAGTDESIWDLTLAPDLNSLLATGTTVNATGTKSDPNGKMEVIIDSTLTSLGFTYVGGFNTMNDIGYSVVTPAGTEDTGGGDADVLVTRSGL